MSSSIEPIIDSAGSVLFGQYFYIGGNLAIPQMCPLLGGKIFRRPGGEGGGIEKSFRAYICTYNLGLEEILEGNEEVIHIGACWCVCSFC